MDPNLGDVANGGGVVGAVYQIDHGAVGQFKSVLWDPTDVGGNQFTWAQATPYTALGPLPTPGPLLALGAAAAFGFSRQLRKRIQAGQGVGSTSTPG